MSTTRQTTRRIGTETSKTRSSLLDAAERLMLEEGYAAVTLPAAWRRRRG